jgi:alpha/beta superfamily hydrolase
MVSGMTVRHASAEMDSPSVADSVFYPAQTIPARSLRSLTLPGPAGHLEALLNEGAPDASFAALVCHPHPAGGGTMHNKVVYHAMKVMNDQTWGFRWPTLRFNFRGTGLSQGAHDGQAESDDVQSALTWLQSEFQLPIIVAGFSFGAAMALKACCIQKPAVDIRALAILGLPTRIQGREVNYSSLSTCTLPKLFLSGDNDQFAPAADLIEVTASAHQPKQLALIPGADHFFTGRIELMQQALCDWLRGHFPILPTEQHQ